MLANVANNALSADEGSDLTHISCRPISNLASWSPTSTASILQLLNHMEYHDIARPLEKNRSGRLRPHLILRLVET